MKKTLSLRWRITLVCALLLTLCCLLLTLTHNHYADQMANAIATIPLQPAQSVGSDTTTDSMTLVTPAQIATPARKTFRFQSLAAMAVIVVLGCSAIYWLTGKALTPLHRLDEQIRSRTVADLGCPLPVPASGDEVAGLTASFNQMSLNLNSAFEQQKRFSQCAAHELRTPLSVLKTRMALFRKKGLCATPETAELLCVLEAQTQRLSDLVSDLLALADLRKLDNLETFDIAQLLADTVELLWESAQQHQITLHLQAAPVSVTGNRALLERAAANLIENAIKYSRSGGAVTICAVQTAHSVRIEVIDNGIGIPPEFRERIFEPFFRVDPSRSRQLGGAGLGLSLVKSIAELHGGTVCAEATPDGGSRFMLDLPCSTLSA